MAAHASWSAKSGGCEAEGCVVKDECLRNGRRARRADDKDELMHKPRTSQRAVTLKAHPLHPDAEHTIDILRR